MKLEDFMARFGGPLPEWKWKFLDALSRPSETEIANGEVRALVVKPTEAMVVSAKGLDMEKIVDLRIKRLATEGSMELSVYGDSFIWKPSAELLRCLYAAKPPKQTSTPTRRRSMAAELGEAKAAYLAMMEAEDRLDLASGDKKRLTAELAKLYEDWANVPQHVKRRVKQAVARKARRQMATNYKRILAQLKAEQKQKGARRERTA